MHWSLEADDGQDGKPDHLVVDNGPVPSDDAGIFQLADALGDCRRGQPDSVGVVFMAFSSTSTSKKFAAALLRRNQRLSRASVDINADFEGRRATGDPRLDLAMADRYLRL